MISEAFSKPTYSINQEKFCENRSNKKQINEKSNWIQIQSEEQSVYGLLGKVQGEKPCWRHGVMDRVWPALTPPHPRTHTTELQNVNFLHGAKSSDQILPHT